MDRRRQCRATEKETRTHVAIATLFAQARTTPDKAAVVHNGIPYTYAALAGAIERTRRRLLPQALRPRSLAIICADSLLDSWVLLFALRCLGVSTIALSSATQVKPLRLRDVAAVVTSADERTNAEQIAAECGVRVVRVLVDLREAASIDETLVTPEVPANGSPRPAHVGHDRRQQEDSAPRRRRGACVAPTGGRDVWLHGTIAGVCRQFSAVDGGRLPLGADRVERPRDRDHSPGRRPASAAVPAFADAHLRDAGELVRAHVRDQRRRPAERRDATHGDRRRDVESHVARREAVRHAAGFGDARLHGSACRGDYPDRALGRPSVASHRSVARSAGGRRTRQPDAGWSEGQVRIRIDDGIEGYLDDPIATREFFRDGYFYPGDMGQFAPDGRLSLRGRVSDVVNVLGIKIATGAIEQALQDRLGANGICIVSIASENERAMHDEIHPDRGGTQARACGDRSCRGRGAWADQARSGAHRIRCHDAAQRHGQDRSARAQGRAHAPTRPSDRCCAVRCQASVAWRRPPPHFTAACAGFRSGDSF